MSADTPLKDRREFHVLCAAWIHVASKEEYTGNTGGGFRTKDQGDTGPIAPAHHGCFVHAYYIHHGQNVGGHALIGKRPRVARTATMAAAVDQHGSITGSNKGRYLPAPVAAVAEAAMQEDYGPAGTEYRVADPRPIVLNV